MFGNRISSDFSYSCKLSAYEIIIFAPQTKQKTRPIMENINVTDIPNTHWEEAGKVSPEQLEEQTNLMLSISEQFLTENQMDNIVRPNKDQCFVIYFLGRMIGKFNKTAIVRDPYHPGMAYSLLMGRLSENILNPEARLLITNQPKVTQYLFALGIHVSNVEDRRVNSDTIKFEY